MFGNKKKVDCQWSEWSESKCTATCGVFAIKKKTRIKAHNASNGGIDCVGDYSEIVLCGYQKCPGKCNIIWLLSIFVIKIKS